jgi:Flp pilus assembly pilin Flp
MLIVPWHSFRAFMLDQSGATAIEYVMIASAMGLALIASAPILSNAVKGKLLSVGGYFTLF